MANLCWLSRSYRFANPARIYVHTKWESSGFTKYGWTWLQSDQQDPFPRRSATHSEHDFLWMQNDELTPKRRASKPNLLLSRRVHHVTCILDATWRNGSRWDRATYHGVLSPHSLSTRRVGKVSTPEGYLLPWDPISSLVTDTVDTNSFFLSFSLTHTHTHARTWFWFGKSWR